MHRVLVQFLRLFGFPIGATRLVSTEPGALADTGALERARTRVLDGLRVTAAALSADESQKIFGIDLAGNGIQPIWIEAEDQSGQPRMCLIASSDPNYFTPLEAAHRSHLGSFFWYHMPPIQRLNVVRRANAELDRRLMAMAYPRRMLLPKGRASGFIYCTLRRGVRVLSLQFATGPWVKHTTFEFELNAPDPDLDHEQDELEHRYTGERAGELRTVDLDGLRRELEKLPRATANRKGTREGDPANLAVVGSYTQIMAMFSKAGWTKTERLHRAATLSTIFSYLLGRIYRFAPVSPLHLFGRRHDFALQKVRESIHERNHLRLWLTPVVFDGMPVWVGQVSRDIGVRFTLQTLSLTTHIIDADVDDARDSVMVDLLWTDRVRHTGYVKGVEACTFDSPRRNLTGEPYFTDGCRGVVFLSKEEVEWLHLDWETPYRDEARRREAGAPAHKTS
jgi:hypothetical protein